MRKDGEGETKKERIQKGGKKEEMGGRELGGGGEEEDTDISKNLRCS